MIAVLQPYLPGAQDSLPPPCQLELALCRAGADLVAAMVEVGGQENFIFGPTTKGLLVRETEAAVWAGQGRAGRGGGNQPAMQCLPAAARRPVTPAGA